MSAFELATSRYQASDLILASGLVPVGISVGRPKFHLGYEPVLLSSAAPFGLLRIEDAEEFGRRYVARLESVGIDRFERQFAEISEAHDTRGLVFLCYEAVPAECHRHVFARWIEHHTGRAVPELEPPRELRIVRP